MSEEEKKAYDNLIMLKYFTMEKEDKKSIEIILNLIDKQQTEIEELKKENKDHLEALTEWVNGERINDIKHISKDKIRKEIKELENLYKNKYFHLDYVKEILEKLLEE